MIARDKCVHKKNGWIRGVDHIVKMAFGIGYIGRSEINGLWQP